MRDLDKHQGGAEVPVSLLYTDVQGSTTLAECLENVAKKFTDRQMIDGYLQVYTDAIADRARPDLPDRR
jgi:class 3 adenylate cyclase